MLAQIQENEALKTEQGQIAKPNCRMLRSQKGLQLCLNDSEEIVFLADS